MFLFRRKKIRYQNLEEKIKELHPVQRALVLIMSNACISVLSTFFKKPFSSRPYNSVDYTNKAYESVDVSYEQAKQGYNNKEYQDQRFALCYMLSLELVSMTLSSIHSVKQYHKARHIWSLLWASRSRVPRAIKWINHYEGDLGASPIPYAQVAGKRPWTDMDYERLGQTVPYYIRKDSSNKITGK